MADTLETQLIDAVEDGDNSSVCSILEQGISPNIRDQGATLLMIASYLGHLNIVKTLSDRGGDVNATNEDGGTPLMMAVQQGHSLVVKELLERHADVNAATNNGFTALMKAVQQGHSQIVSELLERHADVNIRNHRGWPLLMMASYYGDLHTVKLLCDSGADIHATNENGFTALMYAAGEGKSQVVSELLERHADMHAVDRSGSTALDVACQNGHLDCVRILADNGASVELGDSDGRWPLHTAVKKNHARVVELLIEKGAVVDQVDKNGATPLMAAAYYGADDSLEVLLNKGADPDKQDNRGHPALVHAVHKKFVKTAKTLMSVTRVGGEIGPRILAHICRQGLEQLVGEFLQKVKSLSQGEKVAILREGMETAVEYGEDRMVEILLNEQKKIREEQIKEADLEEKKKDKKQQEKRERKKQRKEKQGSDIAKLWSEQKRMDEKKEEEARKAEAKRKSELETIRKRQEEKKLKDQRRGDPKEEIIAQFQNSCKDASTCLAVCRFENCEQVQASAHILPSQNIYYSDPNHKGYYKVFCNGNCQISYHKACWTNVKGKRTEKSNLVKGPTEKELLGLTCFTPDCGAVIVKIEIIDENGKVTTIQDMKIIEKLEVDERKKKEESQLKKKTKNEKERFKNFEKKQTKESYLNCSNKRVKEKSKCSDNGAKEKSEHNQKKINPTVLEMDDRHYKFTSHEIVDGKKVKKIKENSHCEEIAHEIFNGDNYKASPVKGEQSISQDENTKKLDTRLNPSALDFVPVNKEDAASMVTIQESKQEAVTKNAASRVAIQETRQEDVTKNADSPRQISSIGDNHSTDLNENEDMTDFKNNNVLDVSVKVNKNLLVSMSTSTQTDSSVKHLSHLDPLVLQHQNENLMLELQEMKDKLLRSKFKIYSEVLAQRRANNQRVITHLIGSSELNQLPQVQIALNTLDEFSARLFQAEEELNDQYENLMRQSRYNKAILELEFDLSSIEPPNLEPSYLDLLHNFIIMNQSSSPPTSSPFSSTSVPPPSISQSSSTSSSRDNPHCPSPTPPLLPGNPEFSSSLAGPKMYLYSQPGGTCNDSFATVTSRSTSSPTNFSAPDSQLIYSAAYPPSGCNVEYPSNGVAFTTPSSGATAPYFMSLGLPLVPKNSATPSSTGSNHTPDQYQDNICPICHEAMIASDSSLYLDPCRHRFHTDCVNPWLAAPGGVGSTCPMCRNYVVNEKEYPNLGRVARRF